MTKKEQELVKELSNLASQMEKVANQMLKFRGEIKEHGNELLGASGMVWDWFIGIKEKK